MFFVLLTRFQNYAFQNIKKIRNTIRVSNSFDPGQERCLVGPDLGPNYLQRSTADEKRSPLGRSIYLSQWMKRILLFVFKANGLPNTFAVVLYYLVHDVETTCSCLRRQQHLEIVSKI